MRPTEGIKPPASSIPKRRGEGTGHQLQAPFDDQTRNEMKITRLYESICVGFGRFPKFPMEFPGVSYKPTPSVPFKP